MWGQYDRLVFVGGKTEKLACTIGPPTAFEPDFPEEYLLTIERFFELTEIGRNLTLLSKMPPHPSVYHTSEDVGSLVHGLPVALDALH